MFVSVIIPTFNRAKTIVRAVQSVLDQTYKNYELIIIDDGSTDNTKELLQEFIKYENVFYSLLENQGVSSARNTGVRNSRGQWIAFLDSDDEWLPFKLSLQIDYISKNKEIDFIHTNENWIRSGERVNLPKKYSKDVQDIFKHSLEFCIISPSTVLMKKSLFTEQNGFREDFIVCEDFDLWLKILSLKEIGFISEVCINKYGGHSDQLSTKFFAMDYWRVKSLKWILDNRGLEFEIRESVVRILNKKCKRLIKGYNKHSNYANLDEVKLILDSI